VIGLTTYHFFYARIKDVKLIEKMYSYQCTFLAFVSLRCETRFAHSLYANTLEYADSLAVKIGT
jgi:hypothetical protein